MLLLHRNIILQVIPRDNYSALSCVTARCHNYDSVGGNGGKYCDDESDDIVDDDDDDDKNFRGRA